MEGVVAWIAYGLHYAGWVGVPGAPVHLTFIVGQGWHSEPRGGVRKCIARQTVRAEHRRRARLLRGI